MGILDRSSKVLAYTTARMLLLAVVFNRFFSVRYIFRSLDVLLFGFTLYPGEIVTSVLCMAVSSYLIFAIDSFLGVILNIYRMNKQDKIIQAIGSSIGIDGVQGIGKTRTLIYFAMILQPEKWEQLRFDYYLDCPFQDVLATEFENGSRWQYVRFLSRKDSVHYYINDKDKIPLIWSTIGIMYKGQSQRNLEIGHFNQDLRLYENNILIGSELDDLLPNTLRKVKDEKKDVYKANLIDEFAGLHRQYTNGTLLADTHRNDDLFLSIRNCQQLKYHFYKCVNMYKPVELSILIKLLKKIVMITKEKTPKALSKITKIFMGMYKSIGFTKLYYVLEEGASSLNLTNDDRNQFLILPDQVPYIYDDRYLQENYKPLKKKIELDIQSAV